MPIPLPDRGTAARSLNGAVAFGAPAREARVELLRCIDVGRGELVPDELSVHGKRVRRGLREMTDFLTMKESVDRIARPLFSEEKVASDP